MCGYVHGLIPEGVNFRPQLLVVVLKQTVQELLKEHIVGVSPNLVQPEPVHVLQDVLTWGWFRLAHRSVSDATVDLLCFGEPMRQNDPAAKGRKCADSTPTTTRNGRVSDTPEQNHPSSSEDCSRIVKPQHLNNIFHTTHYVRMILTKHNFS